MAASKQEPTAKLPKVSPESELVLHNEQKRLKTIFTALLTAFLDSKKLCKIRTNVYMTNRFSKA